MSQLDPVAFGITIVVFGLALVGLAYLLLRVLPRIQVNTQTQMPPIALADISTTTDAVLLIQAGGRVLYINQLAREWFGLLEEVPNIEYLARRTRPGDVFIGLCATEGFAHFTLNGRLVNGTSYSIPYGSGRAVLVTLSRPPLSSLAGEEGAATLATEQTIDIFTELSQTMAASLDLEPTLRAILESVERLIPSDFSEITIWESEHQRLVPYRFTGMPGVDREVTKTNESYHPDEGFSGYLVTHHTPLLVGDVESYRAVRPTTSRGQYAFNSYLGIPLLVANDLVGTLELASHSKDAFTQSDLETLRILSGQAAVALKNALLYQEQKRRILELSGLAQLSRAVSALSDPKDLYSRLVESIKPLLNVEVLGFWVYDEERRTLEAQLPFTGMPPEYTDLFHISVPTGNQADEILRSQETIWTNHTEDDPRLAALDMTSRAQAAGIQDTVLIPLSSAGRLLGYLQVGDKLDGTSFDEDDLRLLTIIGGQAAVIIENAALIQQTQGRAQRAESLRKIASLTGSTATLDEILKFSLLELARLLRADFAIVLKMDEDLGRLLLHEESTFGLSGETLNRLKKISPDLPRVFFTPAGNGRGLKSFTSGDALNDARISPAYRPWVEALEATSVLGVPLTAGERLVGEILLGSRAENSFDQSDLILLETIAGQLASAIDRTTLYAQTDENLRWRVDQYASLARISREMNATTDLQRLLRTILDESLRVANAVCGAILLLDPAGMPHVGLKITSHIEEPHDDLFSDLELEVLDKKEATIIDDFAQEIPVPGRTVPTQSHDGVRSALLAPVIYQDKAVGLIHLHSTTPRQFSDTAKEIVQNLALHAGIAFGTTYQYQEQVQRSENLNQHLSKLTRAYQTTQLLQLDQPLEIVLEGIAESVKEIVAFKSAEIGLFDKRDGQPIQSFTSPGSSMSGFTNQTLDQIRETLKPEFQTNGCYLIPNADIPSRASTLDTDDRNIEMNASIWRRGDRLVVPLTDQDGQVFGLIALGDPQSGLPPDPLSLEILGDYSRQAALALLGHHTYHTLKDQVDAAQEELNRQRTAIDTAQSNLPFLLNKDLEQTLTIRKLSQRVEQVQSFWQIAETLSRQADRSSVLLTLGKEILTKFDLDIALIAEPSEHGPRLIHVVGAIPSGVNPEALLGQRNPLRHCIERAEAGPEAGVSNVEANLFVTDIKESQDWRQSPLLQALGARGFICLNIPKAAPHPFLTSEGSKPRSSNLEAVLLGVSLSPLPTVATEDEQLYMLLTGQVSAVLQNLHLLTETNRRLLEVDLLLDFSRKLGTLDPASILQTLVQSALQILPAAQAAMVALWDPHRDCLIPQAAVGYRYNQSVLEVEYHRMEALPGIAYAEGRAIRIDEIDFARDYNLPSDHIVRYRDATGGRLPISAMVIPITSLVATDPTAQSKDSQKQVSPLGILVLENFTTTTAFSRGDQDIIASLAQQTALTLENARLYQASEQRAVQLKTLTDVAATITSSLQINELVASLLDQVKTVIPYDTGTLWIRQGERLAVQAASGFEDSEERIGLSVALEDSLLMNEMTNTGQYISVGDVREDSRFPPLVEHRYLSWLGVPLLAKNEVIGVIALEKSEPNFYTPEHIQAITTFAGQSAVALVNANLYEESQRKAEELDRRSKRLALLNRLSTELGSTLDASYILKLTTQEMLLAINSTSVSAILFDPAGDVILEVESPATRPDLPLILPNAPIFSRLRESMGIFHSEDIRNEQGRIIYPELALLNEYLTTWRTHGLLILPLATGNDLHGLILINQDHPYRFTVDEIELARTITNQSAVAIQNANLFAETQWLFTETRQSSAELATLYDLGVKLTQVLEQKELIQIAFGYITHLLQVNSAALVLRQENGELIGLATEDDQFIGPITIPSTGISFSEYVLSTGEHLLIGDIERDRDRLPVPGYTVGAAARSWVGVPLIVRGTAIGVLSSQSDEPDHFGEPHIRLLHQIANQLAVAVDNARLFTTVQNYASELEQRVAERTAQLAKEHKRTQTLLGIISELSTSLDMDIVLNRTLSLINETTGAEHSLIMLIMPDQVNLFVRASLGYRGMVPKGGLPSALKADEGLAGWVISNRQPVLISDLMDDSRWVQAIDSVPQHRSAIAVPLEMGEETLGALLLFHQEVNQFSPDQLDLVEATAKQIAVAINNAQLYSLIRDQAERLGDMLRRQHVETSQSQAILEAVADGVLVTDANRIITLFNVSAERVLGLSREDIVGQSLENFTGLFGKAAFTWMDTIRAWSDDPSSIYQEGDGYAYSEHIQLEDKRVVAVHLAPVRLRNDFLGTVSIFRDITHQVLVDRLKSEFVATVSHELRTPMTSIKGYVEILLLGAAGKLNERQTHFLEIVRANTDRLAVLVNDLLDISRIEAGRVTLSLQPLDIRAIIDEALTEISRRSQEDQKPMNIRVNIPEGIPRVVGDMERVRQILDNLLENAYYYTPQDGKIVINGSQVGSEVQIDIVDTGIGILPSEQPRVFERFYRGEDPMVLATSGTGLGLSITQRLVEMHKGRIWLQSTGVPGEGSTFSFTLPVYIPEKIEAEADDVG